MKAKVQNSDKEITAKINEIFKVELKENPSTGYLWAISKLPTSVYLINSTYIADPHPSGWTGGGGTRTFHFKAISADQHCVLNFTYMRSWEKIGISEYTCVVDIESTISYHRLADYFVKNTYEPGKHCLVMNSMDEFNRVFSPAALMHTKQTWLKESDFDKNYILAVVMPTENTMTQLNVKSLDENKKTLDFKYTMIQSDISYTARPCMILLVEKATYDEVLFIENNKEEAKVHVPEVCEEV